MEASHNVEGGYLQGLSVGDVMEQLERIKKELDETIKSAIEKGYNYNEIDLEKQEETTTIENSTRTTTRVRIRSQDESTEQLSKRAKEMIEQISKSDRN